MADLTNAQQDIRWFIAWAQREGLPKPSSAEMDEHRYIGIARQQAAMEWEAATKCPA